ncbi:MAG: hypothetical protein IKN64_12710 [Desulfovibrio sp.]|nr:hypothetical protein [Desulfovibrio sp.]
MKQSIWRRVWEGLVWLAKACLLGRQCPAGRVCRAGMNCPANMVCVEKLMRLEKECAQSSTKHEPEDQAQKTETSATNTSH